MTRRLEEIGVRNFYTRFAKITITRTNATTSKMPIMVYSPILISLIK